MSIAERRGRGAGLRRIDLSQMQVASSGTAREINRDIVLELVRVKQPLSRVELARMSGLQPSTVSEIAEQLLGEGWIREGELVRGARGRPSTMLTVNEAVVMFALDIRPDRAKVAVVDLLGRFLAQEDVETEPDPRRSLHGVMERLRALQARFAGSRFEGIGVSVPGRVDPDTQELLLAPNLHWSGYDLKGRLESAMGMQVEMENDANACLLAESWSGRLAGVQHAVLVAISEGVGTAILAGGQLYGGFGGLAGEFGHVEIEPSGPACGCGRRGCWEVVASSRAALRAYAELTGEAVEIGVLLRRTERGDQAALEAVTRQAKAIGRGLRLLVAGLAPEVVLVTGEITQVWERFGPVVEGELQAGVMAGSAPRVLTAGDGESARLRGAAAVLLHAHGGYLRSNKGVGVTS